MKRIYSLLLALIILSTLCACEGNWEKINLQDAVQMPKSGVISQSILQQAKDENAIAVFTGNAEDLAYEWTVFGSDITSPKEVNMSASITKADDGSIHVTLAEENGFGFSALLSIHLEEKWEALSATAYQGDRAVASVSVTGSQYTILNISLDGSVKSFTIQPDVIVQEEAPSTATESVDNQNTTEDYLSRPQNGDSNTYTDGKDKYLTDPVPEGKPKPVEPEDQTVDQGKQLTCTFTIDCATILNNLDLLEPGKFEMVPSDGTILATTTVVFYEGESVFDVLQRLCQEKGIHMEAQWTPIYNSAYIEGIHNLYEFDCGALSGWMYSVNGWYPNYGCSRYQLKNGDVVKWRYTCDLGNDVGGAYAVGG